VIVREVAWWMTVSSADVPGGARGRKAAPPEGLLLASRTFRRRRTLPSSSASGRRRDRLRPRKDPGTGGSNETGPRKRDGFRGPVSFPGACGVQGGARLPVRESAQL
jgi:hypothetical protein